MVAGTAELPSNGLQDTQLPKRRGPVVQPDFLGDFAVLDHPGSAPLPGTDGSRDLRSRQRHIK